MSHFMPLSWSLYFSLSFPGYVSSSLGLNVSKVTGLKDCTLNVVFTCLRLKLSILMKVEIHQKLNSIIIAVICGQVISGSYMYVLSGYLWFLVVSVGSWRLYIDFWRSSVVPGGYLVHGYTLSCLTLYPESWKWLLCIGFDA